MTNTKKQKIIAEYIEKGINPILLTIRDKWDNNNVRYQINLQDCLDFLLNQEQDNITAACAEHLTKDFKDLDKRITRTGIYMGYTDNMKEISVEFQDSYDKAKAEYEAQNPDKTFEQHLKEEEELHRRNFNGMMSHIFSGSVGEEMRELMRINKGLGKSRRYHN